MVKILANGDIVADDDPRASQAHSRQTGDAHSGQRRVQSTRNIQQDNGNGPQVNIFQSLNQRLVALGIPPFTFGDIVVEPIVSVGLLIALLVFGFPGLILGLVLFVVSRWSTHGAPEIVSRFFGGGQRGGNGRPDNRHQGRAGGGYRLGR
ncbi:unnamed protein product [Candidula unifasciata]|uniref:DUF4605 domain-containing protein n=1 Tax=Candidula unifasciata TaxID=100452 RepID=A0A8S3ZHW6_9EUPU|nr:unnamed protein product [Candidula unifasciata]